MDAKTGRREFLVGAVSAAAATALAGCATGGGGCGACCAKDAAPAGALRIAHMGDPQFGFGSADGYSGDLKRFEAALELVEDLKPDAVFLAGDMTHDATKLECDWPRLLRRIAAPVVAAPGNHDMGNTLSRENLERFRRVFGCDRSALDVGGWRIVCGNSQFWFPTGEAAEKARYEEWVDEQLSRGAALGGRLVLASHFPPFAHGIAEEDQYWSHPKKGRAERFARYVAAGARFYLAGHTHSMLARAHDGIVVLNAETTCRNFDGRPFGFRMLTLQPDFTYTWDFHRVC